MSVVTDIILVTLDEDVEEFNKWFPNVMNIGPQLKKVDEYAGGGKVMQCNIHMGAVNYLLLNEFLQFFQSWKWEFPETVQLMIKHEDDFVFKIYEAGLPT